METMLTPNEILASPLTVSSFANAPPSPLSLRKKYKPRPFEDLFPAKLYHMLDEVETMGLSAAVSWQPHGRAFMIHNRQLFMAEVVPIFFKATKIRSFQRQLHLWGFHRISTGHEAGAFWHESFVRGRPDDLKHIVRTRIKGNVSSMNDEPNFYEIFHLAVVCDEVASRKKVSGEEIATSGSGMVNEFEHLDEELESLLVKDDTPSRRVSLTPPPATAKWMYPFGDVPAHDLPALNLNGSDDNRHYTLNKREPEWNFGAPDTSAGSCAPMNETDVLSSKAIVVKPFPCSSVVIPAFTHNIAGNDFEPDRETSMYDSCDGLFDLDYGDGDNCDDLDEFSVFIDKMIQLP